MFLFYVLSFFKKGDTIQGGTLFKGKHYLRKYGTWKTQEHRKVTYNAYPKLIQRGFQEKVKQTKEKIIGN